MPATVSIKEPTLQTHTEISPEVLKDFPFELVIMARGLFVKVCSAVWKTVGFPPVAQCQRFGSELAAQASQDVSGPGLVSTGFIHGGKHLVAMCLCPPTPAPPWNTRGQELAPLHCHCTLQGNWAEGGQCEVPKLCLGSGEEQQVSKLKKIQKSSLK